MNKDKHCGIYKFTNKINEKVYIGKSVDIEGRYKSHFKPSELNKDCIFNRALRKYGKDGFTFNIILECAKEELNYWEKYFIKIYDSTNPNKGYNMQHGGDGVPIGNIPWNKNKHNVYSENTKKLMGDDKKGRPSPRKGVKLTQETNDLISAHCKGKRISEEAKQKMSIIKTGKNNPFYGHISCWRGKEGPNKGKHRVYENLEHTKWHFE